MKEHEETSE